MSRAAFTTDYSALTSMSAAALLAQEPVCMLLPEGWERPKNFPLPITAHKESLEREFRPLAVLEWVNDELASAAAAARAQERAMKDAA